jgi:hypothetical protein
LWQSGRTNEVQTKKEVTVAKRQGKLKLGKSSWFVKRRLSWLPQEDLVREADFCPLPEVLGGNGLWLGLVVSHHDGSVVAQEVLEHAPDVNDLAKLLAEAMERPLMEQTRCRPKAFHLRDNPEWDELRPHLAQLSIEVVVTEELLKWEEVFADLIDYLKGGEWKQPVIDIAGDVEGGDERQDRLLGLRLAVILYPAVRKANKTK